MDVFEYMAAADPSSSVRFCKDYGYSVIAKNNRDIAYSLKQLTARHGEPAFREMIQTLHPDRELFDTLHNESEHTKPPAFYPTNNTGDVAAIERYLSANGVMEHQRHTQTIASAMQGNTFIFAAALFLTAAIIFKQK